MPRFKLKKRESASKENDGAAAADEPVADAPDHEVAVDGLDGHDVDGDAVDVGGGEGGVGDSADEAGAATKTRRRSTWLRALVYGVLPTLALLFAAGAGFLKWQGHTDRVDDTSRIESLQVAEDSTIALLSYQPNTVEEQLNAARDLLTGDFRDEYTQLINDVVIPGAKQQQISVAASVPAIASVSADDENAVALVYVNQETVIGTDPPTDSNSSVRVSMEKVDGRWLVSGFEPV